MHPRRTPEKTIHLCTALLLFAVIASTTAAGPQKLVIDEHVNPRWIDDDRLEFSRTEDGRKKRLQIDRETGVVSDASAGTRGDDRLPGRRVTESSARGGDVPIIFINDTKQPIRLMWVNDGGTEVPYGRLEAGGQRRMGTYDGHAWRMLDADGRTLTAFVAEPGRPRAVIDERSMAEWQASAKSQQDGDRADPPSDPTPGAKVTTRDGDLWIKRPGVEPERLTTDARPDSTWRSNVNFSPDGRFFLARKVDAPQKNPVHLLEVMPDDQVKPVLQTHQYLKPGDQIASVNGIDFSAVSHAVAVQVWGLPNLRNCSR